LPPEEMIPVSEQEPGERFDRPVNLLMEQIVNTDGMVSEGNSTCEPEAPVTAGIRPVVLFPEEFVTGKILDRVVLTGNHVRPSMLVSIKYEVTHWSSS